MNVASRGNVVALKEFFLEPAVLAYVSWLGLAVTVLGFSLAIWQIRKVKRASDAAARAMQQVVHVAKDRVTLSEVEAALGFVAHIKTLLGANSFAIALIYLDSLRAKLLIISEYRRLAADDSKALANYTLSITLITDELNGAIRTGSAPDTTRFVATLNLLSDLLVRQSGRLRLGESELAQGERDG